MQDVQTMHTRILADLFERFAKIWLQLFMNPFFVSYKRSFAKKLMTELRA